MTLSDKVSHARNDYRYKERGFWTALHFLA
jgi:hypothetical protein